jgi:hypothetical protein
LVVHAGPDPLAGLEVRVPESPHRHKAVLLDVAQFCVHDVRSVGLVGELDVLGCVLGFGGLNVARPAVARFQKRVPAVVKFVLAVVVRTHDPADLPVREVIGGPKAHLLRCDFEGNSF